MLFFKLQKIRYSSVVDEEYDSTYIYLVEHFEELNTYHTLIFTLNNKNIFKKCDSIKGLPYSIFRKLNKGYSDIEELSDIEGIFLISEYGKNIENYLKDLTYFNEKDEKIKEYFLNYINNILGDEQ